MRLIISLLLNGLFVLAIAYLLPGVATENFQTALIAGLVLGLLNFLVRPILSLLALPITILTLGLFQLVINAFMVMLVSEWVDGFEVENIWWGIGFVILLSIMNSLFGLRDRKEG